MYLLVSSEILDIVSFYGAKDSFILTGESERVLSCTCTCIS